MTYPEFFRQNKYSTSILVVLEGVLPNHTNFVLKCSPVLEFRDTGSIFTRAAFDLVLNTLQTDRTLNGPVIILILNARWKLYEWLESSKLITRGTTTLIVITEDGNGAH